MNRNNPAEKLKDKFSHLCHMCSLQLVLETVYKFMNKNLCYS